MAAGAGSGWWTRCRARPPRHAVTLTGVGERVHLMSSADHAGDAHRRRRQHDRVAEELHDVVLAVHSYAGMIGTAVADRMPERLRHLVYVDAVVPRPGESWSSTHASATREARLAAAQARPTTASRRPTRTCSAWRPPTTPGSSAARRRTRPHLPGAACSSTRSGWRRAAHLRRLRQAAGHHRLDPAAVRDPKFWDGAWRGGGGMRWWSWRPGTTRWSARRPS
jgi:pimeloyl-ACP methyl ester carboxylesterase